MKWSSIDQCLLDLLLNDIVSINSILGEKEEKIHMQLKKNKVQMGKLITVVSLVRVFSECSYDYGYKWFLAL